MKTKKVVLVTGGTSGIGEACVRKLLEEGCMVYECSRRAVGTVPGATPLSCDVTDEAQVQAAVDKVVAEAGRIDAVINNAGFGISGAIEYTKGADARKQFDVNFFGLVNVNHAVLPYLHRQKSGRIVNISSVAAPIAIPFQAYYSASKAAILSYSLALLNEVRPYGIQVVTILPGDIKTGFTAAREKSIEGDDAYGGRIGRSVAVMEHDEQNGIDPGDAAAVIVKQALCKRPKTVCTIGGSYKLFVFLSRIVPYNLMYRIVGMIYGK